LRRGAVLPSICRRRGVLSVIQDCLSLVLRGCGKGTITLKTEMPLKRILKAGPVPKKRKPRKRK
jgi:hypothetical protein